jgi:hypothetical protein
MAARGCEASAKQGRQAGMHHNPVSKKWQLVMILQNFEYSSASFYEEGIKKYDSVHYLIFILIED